MTAYSAFVDAIIAAAVEVVAESAGAYLKGEGPDPWSAPVEPPSPPPQPSCVWWLEDEEGHASGPPCGMPATHISCVPNDVSPTCEEHKCRCAKPIESKSAVSPPSQPEAGPPERVWVHRGSYSKTLYVHDYERSGSPNEPVTEYIRLDAHEAEVARLTKERDEARLVSASLTRRESELKDEVARLTKVANDYYDSLHGKVKERDEARDEVVRLTKERDDARRERQSAVLDAGCDRSLRCTLEADIDNLKRERDEARAEGNAARFTLATIRAAILGKP